MVHKFHKIKSIREVVKYRNHLYWCEYNRKIYRYVGITGITRGILEQSLIEVRYGCYCITAEEYSRTNAPNCSELSPDQWKAISNYVLRRLI